MTMENTLMGSDRSGAQVALCVPNRVHGSILTARAGCKDPFWVTLPLVLKWKPVLDTSSVFITHYHFSSIHVVYLFCVLDFGIFPRISLHRRSGSASITCFQWSGSLWLDVLSTFCCNEIPYCSKGLLS